MASWGMAISTLLGVYHELRLAEPVVPGSVLSLYHAFTPLILVTAWWGGAYLYPCFQMGKLGFRELRCLAHMSTAISPPCPGCGWACDQSQAPWSLSRTSLLNLAGNDALRCLCWLGVGCDLLPLTRRQPVWGRRARGHTQKAGGRRTADTCGPVSRALLLLDPSQFCELINPLLCNTVWDGFLPPEKSRLIKHLIELKHEYLTSSWLAQQAILFPRK